MCECERERDMKRERGRRKVKIEGKRSKRKRLGNRYKFECKHMDPSHAVLLLILEFSEHCKAENGALFPRWAKKIDLNSIVSQKAFKLSQIELHDIDFLNDLPSEVKLIF